MAGMDAAWWQREPSKAPFQLDRYESFLVNKRLSTPKSGMAYAKAAAKLESLHPLENSARVSSTGIHVAPLANNIGAAMIPHSCKVVCSNHQVDLPLDLALRKQNSDALSEARTPRTESDEHISSCPDPMPQHILAVGATWATPQARKACRFDHV